MTMLEQIGLVICTTNKRLEQRSRCIDSFRQAIQGTGIQLVNRIFIDSRPSRSLEHLVNVRNMAMNQCEERWAFICDDDDFVLNNHAETLLLYRLDNPTSTVIIGQAQNDKEKPIGWTIACSLINVDRFRMVNWLCPSEGGEDFYTTSTLEVRGHKIVCCPQVTWQVCNDCPSLTRDERIELK